MNIANRICAPRLCLDEDAAAICPQPARSIASDLACFNMFGGGASKSETSTSSVDQRTSASEGSLAVGPGGSFQEGGVRGGGNRIGSTEVGSGSTITVTTADAGVLSNALDTLSQLSANYGSSLNQFVSQAQADQDNKVATLLAAADTAKQSEDSSAQNRKMFLYIALAVLALLGLLSWRKR